MARVTSLSAWLVVCLGVVSRAVFAEDQPQGPPRISQPVKGYRKAVLGETVRLPCPVMAHPPPLTMWTKDGMMINYGWDRYRVRYRFLRISNVVVEDGGSYVCRATNGFGSVSVNYTLTVSDGSANSDGRTNPDETDSPAVVDGTERPSSGTLPQFSEPSKMMKKRIVRPLNSSVRLKCKASGHPRPEIIWEKDGTRMVIPEGKSSRVWTLKLTQLKSEDSGSYTCIVFNRHGRINATYVLEVVEQVKEKPDLLGEHPVNTTVEFGGTTSFQCRVRSGVKPHIQWLKRIERHNTVKRINATIEMHDQRFEVLPAGEVLSRPDGSYLNKLMIAYATMEDAGMYICLGANTMGYSFKSAFLEVLPDPNTIQEDRTRPQTPETNQISQSSLGHTGQGLLIGIPLGLAMLFIIAVLMCTVCRNKAQRRRNAAPSQPPNSTVKKEYNRSKLSNPQLDIEQCAPLTSQCAPLTSQQTLHVYPVPSRENALNRYQEVHSPGSYADTLNSNGSLTSSRATMHQHLHHHNMLHC